MLRPGLELCLHWTAAKIFNRRVDGARRHLMGLRPSGKEFEIDAGAGRTAAPLGCAASRGLCEIRMVVHRTIAVWGAARERGTGLHVPSSPVCAGTTDGKATRSIGYVRTNTLPFGRARHRRRRGRVGAELW